MTNLYVSIYNWKRRDGHKKSGKEGIMTGFVFAYKPIKNTTLSCL